MEKKTVVVNLGREKFDVYIGRRSGKLLESKWSNPYKIGKDGTREEVIQKYRAYIRKRLQLKSWRLSLQQLRGKRLGCWCKPLSCHGDVLVEFLEVVKE